MTASIGRLTYLGTLGSNPLAPPIKNDRRGGRFLLGVSRRNQVHRVLTVNPAAEGGITAILTLPLL